MHETHCTDVRDKDEGARISVSDGQDALSTSRHRVFPKTCTHIRRRTETSLQVRRHQSLIPLPTALGQAQRRGAIRGLVRRRVAGTLDSCDCDQHVRVHQVDRMVGRVSVVNVYHVRPQRTVHVKAAWYDKGQRVTMSYECTLGRLLGSSPVRRPNKRGPRPSDEFDSTHKWTS